MIKNGNEKIKNAIFFSWIIFLIILIGKPALAFSSFQYSLTLRYHTPLIWLRLGECCVLHYLKVEKKEKKRGHVSSNDNLNPDILVQDLVGGKKSGRISFECQEVIEKKIAPKVFTLFS